MLQRRRPRAKRVPILLQLSEVECGATCLAMVLSYFGHATTVAECRDQCGIGRDGTTALMLLKAGRSYGLETKAYSARPEAFPTLPLPAIAHWDHNHFVVVEQWSPRKVTIVDPAVGRVTLTPEEFFDHFSGVVLTARPTPDFQPRAAISRAARRRYLQKMWHIPGIARVFVHILLISLVLQGFGVVVPYYTETIVDQVIPSQSLDWLTIIGFGMVVLTLVQVATSLIRSIVLIKARTLLDTHMMTAFLDHLLRLPFPFFQQRPSGDLLMRLESNTTIRDTLTNQTLTLFLDGMLVVGYLVLLLWRAPLLGAVVFGIGLVQITIFLAPTARLRAMAQRNLTAQSDAQSYLVEMLKGVITLKVVSAETRALAHWSTLFQKQIALGIQTQRFQIFVSSAVVLVRSLASFLLLWVGATQVIQGQLSLGAMLGLNSLAAMFLTPFTSLAGTAQQLQMVGVQLDRVADVMDAVPEPAFEPNAPLLPMTGAVSVSGLGYRYTTDAPWALRNISFDLKAGEKVAIVGRTGSGKTTLLMLLLGLYPVTEGQIRYDHHLLSAATCHSIRRQCGVVLQDTFLFNGSVRENLCLNNPSLSEAQMRRAAALACIDDDIMLMPMRYETRVSEGGSALSGGQRQRLALARALATTPRVLMLDEATSHLDAITEQTVDAHLNDMACSRIVIAHRLSTVQNADRILVLDQGELIEQGTHSELIAHNGYYAALMQHQQAARFAPIGLPDLSAAGR